MYMELLGFFIIAVSAVYIYYKYVLFNFWRKKGVFYVEPVVPAGNLTAYVTGRKSLGELYLDAYIKYKNHRAFGMYSFFKPNLVITDLDLIRTVLTKEFPSFHDRGFFCNEKTDPLSGHLFSLPGKKWRNLRFKLGPTFTPAKIKQMFTILKEFGRELTRCIDNKSQETDCIEMKDIFSRYSADVIMSTAFGIEANCIKDPNSEFRRWGKRVFEENSFWVALFVFMPQFMNFFSIPITDRGVTRFFTKIFRENVNYRQTSNVVRHDFMNLLIQLMEKGYVEPDDEKDTNKDTVNVTPTMNRITMSEATAQSYIFYLAGFETSSTTATYCVYELAQHQHLQDKVRSEIDKVLEKHGELTYDAVNEMTYLHKVVNETLRKYPSVPVLNRICTKDINIPTTNIHVPKGTLISIPVFGVHRDPSIYPDPDKFDPERFNADEIATRHPCAHLPFGEGPRNCIGARFGYLQVKVGLVSLLSKFKFKLHPRTAIPLSYDERPFLLIPKGGVYFNIEPR
nr:PREDICTED: probable cytochrome P450 6a14 [Linepithema humile]XP_012215718.1 PREDICTED: probable cytochrome P450 6a14 [Linepithema humile]XP_012215719.1 PREDICTED: probable cytochrome P450 6a14 [Linepithema humile]